MEVNFFHKNLDKKEEGVFMEYVNSKVENITALLTKFATDAVLIKASIEKFDKHDAYSVELFVNIHGKTMVAGETSHTMRKAVDLAKDKLIVQIKKHLSSLRKDRQHREIRKTKVDNKLLRKEAYKTSSI